MSTLVTGAGSGMGRLAALRAAAAGETVAAIDRDPDAAAETAWRSPSTRDYCCDITDPGELSRVHASVTDELGGVDRVVHAAGICEVGSAQQQPVETLRHIMEVNYFGTVNLARTVLPDMLAADHGSLVLFGSLSGWIPSPALAAYSASKAAVNAFAEVLAQETADSAVRVLCVCPGQVETPFARAIRAVDPGILGGRAGSDPARVLNAAERALRDPNRPLYVVPTAADRALHRARRIAPRLLSDQVARRVRVPSGT